MNPPDLSPITSLITGLPLETPHDERPAAPAPPGAAALVCPVCGATSVQEKCKLVCRSAACTYRIVYSCSEF